MSKAISGRERSEVRVNDMGRGDARDTGRAWAGRTSDSAMKMKVEVLLWAHL